MQHRNGLVGLYVRSCALGFLAAAAFVGLLVWGDVARLGHLVRNTEDGLLALFLLWVFNGIVFAGVQFGIAIMSLKSGEEAEDPPPPGGGLRVAVPVRRDDLPPRPR